MTSRTLKKVLLMPRLQPLPFLLSAAMLSLPIHAAAQSVHSAAGTLPTAGAPASFGNERLIPAERHRSPPPLPGMGSSSPRAPHSASASATPYPATTATADASAQGPLPATVQATSFMPFDDALDESVTIDVVDMALTDVLEQLAPTGWRLRFQHVDDAVKAKRVDLTAISTRGDVMHRLLSHAGLSIEPFESFDTPLLLITSSQ